MLLDLFLGLHMDALIKSDREFGVQLGAGISERSSLGIQLSTASADRKLDTTSYEFNYEMQTLFYRFDVMDGWFLNLNAIKREAHEKIGIRTAGTANGDAIPVFDDRMDIDAESYLFGASLGYEFTFANSLYLGITLADYAVAVISRSWSTLEVLQNSGTTGLQKVQEAADAFAEDFSEKEESSFLKISAGMRF